MTPYKLALHVFRRDLRLEDNTALIEALKQSEKVIPCFIFDKRQVDDNAFKSMPCIQFMLHSLQELHDALTEKSGKLYFFYGIAEQVIQQLIETYPIDAVFINRDYTPFSTQRDRRIEDICQRHHIAFHCFADSLLHEPEEVFKSNHEPYTIFTPFYNKASILSVAKPRKNPYTHYYQGKITLENHEIFSQLSQKKNPQTALQGGRTESLALLKNIKKLADYKDIRNFPALNATTHLSAHNKFGTLSIREFYHAVVHHFGKTHILINELFWRDFFTHITHHFPHVLGNAFQHKFTHIAWKNNKKHFQAWCDGMTGFPIVDAGMRELNITGYMHNRVRMIVASFLVKDLHIDWQWGEKYFAKQLIDYDPAVNNGNWQWAASTGCDAQPYFRIFNPWRQQTTYDADCVYIKRWIPALLDLSAKTIHNWYLSNHHKLDYPKPIIDHTTESAKSKTMYQDA